MDAGVLSGLCLSPSRSLCPCLLSLLWLAPLLFLLLPYVRCRLRASYKSYHYSNSFRLWKSCVTYTKWAVQLPSALELWPSFGFKRLHTPIPGCAAGQYKYVLHMCATYCERDELWCLILPAAAAAAAAVLLRTVKSS